MAHQEFATISAGDQGLLKRVEEIVVAAHQEAYQSAGKEWSRPIAYRWLRFEDPKPVERLIEGVEKLDRLGAAFDPVAVENACAEALRRGFSN